MVGLSHTFHKNIINCSICCVVVDLYVYKKSNVFTISAIIPIIKIFVHSFFVSMPTREYTHIAPLRGKMAKWRHTQGKLGE